MKSNFLFYTFLLPVFHLALHLTAQDVPPIWSDRPAETDAVPTIPKGYWQLEAGFGFTRAESDVHESSAYSLPAATLKYGILNSIELRAFFTTVLANGIVASVNSEKRENIYSISTKVNIIHEKGLIPEGSLILAWVFTDLFFEGNKILSSSSPGIRMVFSNTLSEKFSVAYSVGHIGDWLFTIIPAVTIREKWDVFLEYYTDFGFGVVTGFSTDGFNFGFDYIVNDNFKLDIMIGAWLDSEVFNGYAVTGFAWRFH